MGHAAAPQTHRAPRPVSERVKESARFLLILFELGGRAGELANLPIANINIARREYFLKRTKNGRAQMRPLTNFSSILIKQQLEYVSRTPGIVGGRLFTGHGDKPYSYPNAVHRVRRYGMVDPDYHSHANRREAGHLGHRGRHGIPRHSAHHRARLHRKHRPIRCQRLPATGGAGNGSTASRTHGTQSYAQPSSSTKPYGKPGARPALAGAAQGTGRWTRSTWNTRYQGPTRRGEVEPPPTMDELQEALAIIRARRAEKAGEEKA